MHWDSSLGLVLHFFSADLHHSRMSGVEEGDASACTQTLRLQGRAHWLCAHRRYWVDLSLFPLYVTLVRRYYGDETDLQVPAKRDA